MTRSCHCVAAASSAAVPMQGICMPPTDPIGRGSASAVTTSNSDLDSYARWAAHFRAHREAPELLRPTTIRFTLYAARPVPDSLCSPREPGCGPWQVRR